MVCVCGGGGGASILESSRRIKLQAGFFKAKSAKATLCQNEAHNELKLRYPLHVWIWYLLKCIKITILVSNIQQ